MRSSIRLEHWFRPAVLKMKGYTPGEQPTDLSTVKLNTNENPYPPSAAVLKAVKSQADFRLRLYPEPTADTLRKVLSKIHRWPLEGILVGNGSDEILALLFRAAVGKEELVQFPDLTYSLYPVLAKFSEAKIREVRLDASFNLPFKNFSKKAKLTLWGYPNPPVGNCFDLRETASFCDQAEGLVLIDEAYVEFSDRNCLSIARTRPNVIILRTMSKSFSLAGVRLGYALGHPGVIRQIMKVKDSYNVNRMSQAVAAAALSPDGLRDMKEKIKKIKRERSRLALALIRTGFIVPRSQSNFLLAFRPRGKSAEGLYKNLKKRSILVRYFLHPRLKGALRITVGTPEQNDKLIKSLKEILNSK